MSKNDEIDLNLPEMKLRYKKCLMAIEGINSIFEIMGSNRADAMFVLGSIMGDTLYRYYEKNEISEILKRLVTHAKAEYDDRVNEDKLENVDTDVKH